MKQKSLLVVLVVLAIVALAVVPLWASQHRWTYLGPEDYRLVAVVDGIPVVFNALQDKDKEKIRVAEGSTMTESGVQIAQRSHAD